MASGECRGERTSCSLCLPPPLRLFSSYNANSHILSVSSESKKSLLPSIAILLLSETTLAASQARLQCRNWCLKREDPPSRMPAAGRWPPVRISDWRFDYRCHAHNLQHGLPPSRMRAESAPILRVLPLTSPGSFCPAYTPPPYLISRGQVLAVLPFNGNVVLTVDISGAELKTAGRVQNGVSMMPTGQGRFPEVSGFCSKYDISSPVPIVVS